MKFLGEGPWAVDCRMFWPITSSAHGPNQPFSQPVNRQVFSLAWAKSTVYATGASRLCVQKRLSYSNCKWGLWNHLNEHLIDLNFFYITNFIRFFIFDLTFCDLRVVTGKCDVIC